MALPKSNYKGVTWSVRSQRWRVCVHFEGQAYYCGSYKDERTAALKYDAKAASFGLKELNILKPKTNGKI